MYKMYKIIYQKTVSLQTSRMHKAEKPEEENIWKNKANINIFSMEILMPK